ncbi:anti-sigma factor [Bacteroidia bacterium]|nr:anti-sigma factor [Bacteroidia bacterium]
MSERELYLFFKGEASPEQQERILLWLEQDAANREEFVRCRKIFDALLLSDQNSRDFARRSQRLFPRRIMELARIVAVVALMAGCGWWLSSRHIDNLARRTNTIVVPAGQRVEITLPDGTNVWLNSLSELSYPVIFTGGERRVRLTGEGFFDVAHDSRNPFIIEAERYDVRALGTKFNLFSSPTSGEFSISLVEGKVQVSERADNANSIILTPGYEARLVKGEFVRQEIPNPAVFCWREGLFCFDNKSLGDLFLLFERNYDIRIVYDAATLPKSEFSGKFRMSDGIFHALGVLRRDATFSFKWDEERNIIYIRTSSQT